MYSIDLTPEFMPILPSVFVQGCFMVQQRLDREQWLNRILIDLVKMF